jgi:signal transduction histidine kinase
MHAEPSQIPPAQPARAAGDAVLSLHLAITALIGGAVTVIWALTDGGYFWPVWTWFGLGIPLTLHAAVRGAARTPGRRRRRVAIHGAVSTVLSAIAVVVWLLAGAGYFWPIWPMLGLGTVVAVHALLAGLQEQRAPQARERELVDRVDVLTRTRRGALDVQAAELRRIERDLHDGAQARLVALTMQLGRAEERLADRPEVADLLRSARGEASAAIAELRDLARGIAPPVLADRGLGAAAEALGRRAPMPVTVTARVPRRPPPVLETAAYFVVAEALTNVAKHAPGAEARVELTLDDDVLAVEVADDGPGAADPDGGGLTGLRHRVEALDGTLAITSPRAGGTTIRAELPCDA